MTDASLSRSAEGGGASASLPGADEHTGAEPMNAVARIHDEPAAPTGAMTPMAMLQHAVTSGAGIEVMEKLLALQERWEANQGRKAFDAAVSAAKGEIPPIFKNRVVDFTSQKGRTNYRHESLDEIDRVVAPILNKHGLSYRFRAAQDGQKVAVTCILSHRDGYSEETTLSANEDHSGNKNSIQAIGSAATFLQRYTLKLALGLSTTADDDGKAAGRHDDEPRISGAAEAAINSIGECETLEALTAWKEKNDPAVQKLDRVDADAVVRAWKDRARAIRSEAGQ